MGTVDPHLRPPKNSNGAQSTSIWSSENRGTTTAPYAARGGVNP